MAEFFQYDSVSIADRIKLRAKNQNVQLKILLAEVGLGSNTMSHLRHGQMPSCDSLARIADNLNCSVDYLLGRTDDPELHR